MQALAQEIAAILHDYHKYNGFSFDADHVIRWVSQFDDEDQEFILEEFLHLLQQGIYIDEEKGKALLLSSLQNLARRFKFTKVSDFLNNADFLQLQPDGKSQYFLLQLLDELLLDRVKFGINECGKTSKKYAIYVDDILATGGTVFRDCREWLLIVNDDMQTNIDKVMIGDKILIVNLFCRHNWANPGYRLKLDLKREIQNKIVFESHYIIENHPNFLNQRLNFAYPTEKQPPEVHEYLNKLTATNKEESAFRKSGKPVEETFFSSDENRNRLESVLLKKGIQLLARAGTLKPNHRPLGAVTPSYKTLGTGTLFFTWRNISNTTPIVFWWAAGDIWYPLFPLYKRGQGNIIIGH